MKTIKLVMLLILLSSVLMAQISIERSDAYQVGDQIPRLVMQNNQTNGVEFSSVIQHNILYGDQDWVNQFIDTVRYMSTEEFDPEQFFEDADFCFLTEEGFVMFAKSCEDFVELVGIKAFMPFMPDPVNMLFKESLVLMQFPCEYEDTHADTGTADNIQHISEYEQFIEMAGIDYEQISGMFDSVKIEIKYTLNSQFDEYGILTFTGDYNINGNYDYLREKSSLITRMDIFLKSNMGYWMSIGSVPGIELPVDIPMIDTVNTYNYWTKNHMYPIAELIMTQNHTNVRDLRVRHTPNEKFLIEFTVSNQEDELVENAIISIDGFGQLTTDAAGKAEIDMKNGVFTYSVEAEEHFELTEQSFVVDSVNKDITVILEKEENSVEGIAARNINIYPNPSSSYINIDNVKNANIKIFDAQGTLVKEFNATENLNRIDVSTLSTGSYIIQIDNSDYQVNGKIIIN